MKAQAFRTLYKSSCYRLPLAARQINTCRAAVHDDVSMHRVVTVVNGHDVVIYERSREEILFVKQPTLDDNSGEVDLTGLQVWGSAFKLIEYLVKTCKHSPDRGQIKCLELGSGTGIVGIAAAYLGMSVVLTDPGRSVNFTHELSGNTIDCLQGNIELNAAVADQTAVRQLLWGEERHISRIKREQKGEFDLVVGSDLLYEQSNHAPLLATLRAFVNSPTTRAVLCFKTRSAGEEDQFLKQALQHFHVEEVLRSGPYRLVSFRARHTDGA
jgi:predicted nicotinamide N-methyase